MNEYIITKSSSRKPATLELIDTGKLLDNKDFKNDAETIYRFLKAEIPMGTIYELEKIIKERKL